MRGQRADSSRRQQSRLPPIAPRLKAEDQGTESHPTSPVDGTSSGSGRNRLPPRSRRGCWTCRTRKVKCDEQRPACGQCLRLDHTCDYNPRVLFKDDTPRVVERMQEVITAGNSVWDPSATQQEQSQDRSVEDLLPPFSALTTNEEREKKAELKNPGTYHVVANVNSFEALPEYREGNVPISGPGGVKSFAPPARALDEDVALSNMSVDLVGVAEDPNVVILKMFEEPNRKSSLQQASISMTNPVSPASSHASVATTSRLVIHRSTDTQGLSMLDIARSGGRDFELLQHYRTMISPSILRAQRPEGDEDLFEIQARTYPPLFHAMMALAAISMAVQSGDQNTNALEHYQQVIPALKIAVQSSQDSYSDGALFTHFILLVYEIAAAGHREHNMWQHHSDQLLKIITLRRQAYGVDPYDFLIWLVCRMDIYALLSASGTGIFVEVLFKENMLPTPERTLPPLSLNQESVVYLHEQPFFPTLQKVKREVFLIALQVGQVARDLRTEARSRQYESQNPSIPDSLFFMHMQTRAQNLHRVLEHSQATWQTKFPEYGTWLMDLKSLPQRAVAWIQNSYMLLRACLIYAHTSLFPGQLRHPVQGSKIYITTCVTEVLQAARFVVSQEHIDNRFIVFPLFIAGFAASEPAEKELVLTMIRTVEQHSFGGCTQSVRELLELIYAKQREAILRTGDSTLVDWVEEIELRGQPPIIYGI